MLRRLTEKKLTANLLCRKLSRGVFLLWLLPIVFCLLSACSQQMANQPKYKPLRPSPFFDDGQSARPLVEGTVARGNLRDDMLLYTGKVRATSTPAPQAITAGTSLPPRVNPPMPAAPKPGGRIGPEYANVFPFPITLDLLDRGQERFNIYCSPCHGRVGGGEGMIVKRGYRQPPSFHIDRLRAAPVGYFFDVISNGFGAMPDYATQISPPDRWAVIAYLRALQLSQSIKVDELAPAERRKLESGVQK
ncbi:MAG TPA: cytochrome c [Acidobacteriota bacterium]|nr:cytochrome c [Acidobacteriota bacterium]